MFASAFGDPVQHEEQELPAAPFYQRPSANKKPKIVRKSEAPATIASANKAYVAAWHDARKHKDLKEPAIHYWWRRYTESLMDQTAPGTYLRACIDTDPEFETLERRINLLAYRQSRAVLQEEQYAPVTSTLKPSYRKKMATSYEASYIKAVLQEEKDQPS